MVHETDPLRRLTIHRLYRKRNFSLAIGYFIVAFISHLVMPHRSFFWIPLWGLSALYNAAGFYQLAKNVRMSDWLFPVRNNPTDEYFIELSSSFKKALNENVLGKRIFFCALLVSGYFVVRHCYKMCMLFTSTLTSLDNTQTIIISSLGALGILMFLFGSAQVASRIKLQELGCQQKT